MVDGNAGTECDINLDINQISCTDTCPIAIIGPIMSIEIIEFKVKRLIKGNSITWKVDQFNSSYFNLERSNDGISFSIITSINSNGENEKVEYNYIDYSPTDGSNYYRLKEVDNDGSVTYSSVIRTYNDYKDMYGSIKEYWRITGERTDSTDTGIIIELYESGKARKVLKTK